MTVDVPVVPVADGAVVISGAAAVAVVNVVSSFWVGPLPAPSVAETR